MRFCIVAVGLMAIAQWGAWAGMPGTPKAGPVMDKPAGGPLHGGPELDALANKPYRPAWAPLPMFRGDVVATPLLHELLESPDAKVRARSALLLGQIGCPSSTPLLAKHLKDASRAVRVQSGIALACMGDARGIGTCAAALAAEANWIRYYAAYGLWRVNSARARSALRAGLRRQSEFVTNTIEAALKTPYVAPPPVAPLPAGAQVSPSPEPQQVWEEAADVFTRESDWWWHKGVYEQSIRCHEASILLDPEYVESYGVVAWLEWSLGRNDDAIGTLSRAIAAAPKDPDAYFELGHHYFNLKRYYLAEEPLRRAVELGGDHLAQRIYAHCLEKLGKYKESLAQWAALLEDRPTDGAVKMNYERVKKRTPGEG